MPDHKLKIAFVVLHYCQQSITEDCISSLLLLKGNPMVVVVDNASPDDSGCLLKDKYRDNKSVHVILNDRNMGFASANNIGYTFAKNELNAELIIVINNDTIIDDNLFAEKLLSSPLIQKYHVIAPDIINKSGVHQNPKAIKAPRYDAILKNFKKAKINYFIYSIPIIGDIKALLAKPPKYNFSKKECLIDMVVPHGAAVIYTPLWVNKENFAFYPGTFMYGEESLLIYYIINNNYKTIYCPDLEIVHLEDISTKSRFKNKRNRCLFQLKHSIESHKILLKYIKDNHLESIVE